ncbi:hypothetical protein FG05_35110 [Fusarium graminearum]|nr:hypothetical protein FG05_35110 [Fusarium graminearum]
MLPSIHAIKAYGNFRISRSSRKPYETADRVADSIPMFHIGHNMTVSVISHGPQDDQTY